MENWLDRMMPDEYVADIREISLDKLFAAGYRLILTDLDNTLVPWNHPEVNEDLAAWLKRARDIGFEVCILSNNQGPRVKAFAAKAGVPYIAAAKKPKPTAYKQALARFQVSPNMAVMVGDQLFTDIQGGNRSGLHTILVLPINRTEWWGTKITRQAERVVMKLLVKRGLVKPERGKKQG